MGASGEVGLIKGKTAKDAYRDAVEQARYEYGSSYTGSIAESGGYFMHQTVPLLQWEAEQIASRLLDTDGVTKWGPAALIPVAEAGTTRQVTITIDTTGMDYPQKDTTIYNAIKSKLRPEESIQAAHHTTAKKTKIVTIVPNGEAKTVFIVKGHGQSKAFATLTQAKQAAKTTLERSDYVEKFTIVKQTVKGDSDAVVIVERQTTKATTTITATVGKPKRGPIGTWVTAGWYSS